MEYKRLGKTEFNISRIGIGGIPLQRLSQEQATTIIKRALELGVNFIDTARAYTISEEYIGNALEGIRDKFILATKSMARTKDAMAKDVEISLKNLKTDYIDLYQFHLIKTEEELGTILSPGGAMEALLEAKAQGKIRDIGVTCHSTEMLEKVIESGKFSTVQFPYNFIEQQGEPHFKRAEELDLWVIVMKPMAGGAINNASLSIKYILENDNVTVAIPGIDNIEQLEQNISAAQNPRLTPKEMGLINEEREELGSNFCRRCGYCIPCSKGIDIPTMFLLEGYYTRYNLTDWALSRYQSVSARASDCTKCGICETKCPYNLPIRDMMENVNKVFK
jgi:uncharacterized protein